MSASQLTTTLPLDHKQPTSVSLSLKAIANSIRLFWLLFYALATFTGAFLIFQVQPVISKCVLPWFGGTPAVWTTCLLFFQVLLFFGYLYAHLSRQYLSQTMQGIVHMGLLIASALVLPIEPSHAWKPTGTENPTFALLCLLSAHVALPYFTLSSTGPMIQAWLSTERRDKSVYRLYALSNVGSLLALLTYPFVVEPLTSVSFQSEIWSKIFIGFACVMGALAIRLTVRANNKLARLARHNNPRGQSRRTLSPLCFSQVATWVALPAFASIMLLVVTNHVCQDLAVVPFLWILPLSLYLLSFIITFDSPRWYRPKLIAAVTIIAMVTVFAAHYLPLSLGLLLEAGGFFVALLGICTLCHGQVAANQPPTDRLTFFYVLIALGGAVGGITVAVICPLLFDDYRELSLLKPIVLGFAASVYLVHKDWKTGDQAIKSTSIASPLIWAAVILNLIAIASQSSSASTIARRNFFGVLRVTEGELYTKLVHGRTLHGLQMKGEKSSTPTSYYGTQSGVGLAIASLQNQREDLKVGVVGLGCGVLAAYGRESESWDFYEINSDIVEIANENFSFLKDCPADVECHLGDGRLLLERANDKRYDLLIIDAFSSDSIPAHLLTKEAMQLYIDRLTDDGVLAIHVSNQHLRLAPLVHRLAAEVGLESRQIISKLDEETKTLDAQWTLISKNPEIWAEPKLAGFRMPDLDEVAETPLWTDQYHNLLSVLRW